VEGRELIPNRAWRNNPPADLIPGRPLLGRICFTWNTRGRQRTGDFISGPTLLVEALTAQLRLPMGSRCRVVASSHVLRSEPADWERASVSRGTFEVGLGLIYRNTSLVIQRSRLLRPREHGKDTGFDAMCGTSVKEPAWLGGRRRVFPMEQHCVGAPQVDAVAFLTFPLRQQIVPRETSCIQNPRLLDFRLAGVPWPESSQLPTKKAG
jgi:hypothetical protein